MRCQYYVPHRSIKLQQQIHALPASNDCRCNFERTASACQTWRQSLAMLLQEYFSLTHGQGNIIVVDKELSLHARCRCQYEAGQRFPNIPSASREQKQVLLRSNVLHSTRLCPCNLCTLASSAWVADQEGVAISLCGRNGCVDKQASGLQLHHSHPDHRGNICKRKCLLLVEGPNRIWDHLHKEAVYVKHYDNIAAKRLCTFLKFISMSADSV